MALIGISFWLGRVSAKSQPSSFENNQPPSDNSEIQQLKLQLNVVKNQLNNLTNDPQKSQLEDKITTLENKVKDLTNTDKSTIQQLEQEIKEIKEELKNNDKPNDNPHPTDKKEAKLRYAGKGAINEAVFSNVFLEDTFKQGLKVFYVDWNHPQIKQLINEGKLQVNKVFVIRYGKVDKIIFGDYGNFFNENNQELEIRET